MKQVQLSQLRLDDYSDLQLSILRERLDVVLSHRTKKEALLEQICSELQAHGIDFSELCALLTESSGPNSRTARQVKQFLAESQIEESV